jgi:predicted RNase H-like nuclease (RuvC/YqgF family)
MPPPPIKEIQLPYFSIVERLRMMIHDLQSKQDPASTGAQFDEVVDSPEDARKTNTWSNQGRDGSLENAPTQVRKRPEEAARRGGADRLRISELERQVDQLTQLYYQLRDDLDLQLDRQQRELEERDRYIDHLVDTVYEWEERFDGAADGDPGGFDGLDELDASSADRPTNDFDRSETATTSIYRVDDLKRRERAQVDEDASEDDLRDELEELRRERERLERELEERDRRLAELHTQDGESDEGDLAEASSSDIEDDEPTGLGDASSSDIEDDDPTGLGEASSSDIEDDEPTGLGEESSSDVEDQD